MMLKSNGYEDLSLNLGKECRIQKTDFQIEKDEPYSSSSFQNPLQNLRENMKGKVKLTIMFRLSSLSLQN